MAGMTLYTPVQIYWLLLQWFIHIRQKIDVVGPTFEAIWGRPLRMNQFRYVVTKYGKDPDYGCPALTENPPYLRPGPDNSLEGIPLGPACGLPVAGLRKTDQTTRTHTPGQTTNQATQPRDLSGNATRYDRPGRRPDAPMHVPRAPTNPRLARGRRRGDLSRTTARQQAHAELQVYSQAVEQMERAQQQRLMQQGLQPRTWQAPLPPPPAYGMYPPQHPNYQFPAFDHQTNYPVAMPHAPHAPLSQPMRQNPGPTGYPAGPFVGGAPAWTASANPAYLNRQPVYQQVPNGVRPGQEPQPQAWVPGWGGYSTSYLPATGPAGMGPSQVVQSAGAMYDDEEEDLYGGPETEGMVAEQVAAAERQANEQEDEPQTPLEDELSEEESLEEEALGEEASPAPPAPAPSAPAPSAPAPEAPPQETTAVAAEEAGDPGAQAAPGGITDPLPGGTAGAFQIGASNPFVGYDANSLQMDYTEFKFGPIDAGAKEAADEHPGGGASQAAQQLPEAAPEVAVDLDEFFDANKWTEELTPAEWDDILRDLGREPQLQTSPDLNEDPAPHGQGV